MSLSRGGLSGLCVFAALIFTHLYSERELRSFNVDLYSSTATYKKKTNYVRFPLNEFDMSEYIAPSERQSARAKQTVFELYGVSNHYGEINRGHYTAFCKSSHYNK